MAESAAVVSATFCRPRMSRTPTRSCCEALKAWMIGSSSTAPLQSSASAASRTAGVGSRGTTRLSSSSSIMPGLLISSLARKGLDEQRRTVRSSDGGWKLNSSQSTPLPPRESLTATRFASVASGSGVVAMAASSLAAIAARKCRHRRVERNRTCSSPRLSSARCAAGMSRNPCRDSTSRTNASGGDGSSTRSTSGSGSASSGKASCSRWSRMRRFTSVASASSWRSRSAAGSPVP